MCWELQTASIPTLLTHSVPRMMQLFLWPAFFIGFAIKLPLWPFHTWLPDAHVEAPTAGSVILAAVLLKMGGYGMIRFMLPLLPDACQFYSGFAFALGAIAVFYTSLVALAQSDMKKLIAYSSVAHMAFIVLGCFSLNPNGVNGAMVQMISHGFTSAALFFCVGVLYDRVHSREINDYRGIIKKMPYFSGLLLFFTLASIGVPGTSGFVGEILVLIGIYPKTLLMTTVAGTGMIFGAAYMLWLYKRIIYGEANDNVLRLGSEIYWKEAFILIALMIPTLFFGFYPKPILDLSANFVGRYTTTQPPFGQPSP